MVLPDFVLSQTIWESGKTIPGVILHYVLLSAVLRRILFNHVPVFKAFICVVAAYIYLGILSYLLACPIRRDCCSISQFDDITMNDINVCIYTCYDISVCGCGQATDMQCLSKGLLGLFWHFKPQPLLNTGWMWPYLLGFQIYQKLTC